MATTYAAPGEDSTQSTQSSHHTNSSSNPSLLDDDETDEFGQRLREFAKRDRRRMHDATAGGAVQPFRKSRSRQGLSLTMEALERKNVPSGQDTDKTNGLAAALDEDLPRSRKPISRTGSEHSSPPNVPQQWGRKGRQKNDFLRRLSATSPANARDPNEAHDPDAIWPLRKVLTGDSPRSDVDSTENVGLPEERESPLRKVLTYGDPGIVEKRKTSIERKLHAVQDDPSAVAANADDLPTGSHDPSGDQAVDGQFVRRGDGYSSALDQRAGRIPRLRQPDSQTVRNADGAAIGTTKAMPNGAESLLNGSASPPTSLVAVKSEGNNVKSRYRQQDSRDLLRQLAASSTPSPPREASERPSKLPTRRTTFTSTVKQDGLEPDLGASPPLTADALLKHQRAQNLSSSPHYQSLEEELAFLPDNVPPKTPVVTGAWIDTPAAVRQKADKPSQGPTMQNADKPTTSDGHEPKLTLQPPPNHPSSAAAALLQNADHFGESTIGSLRALLNQDDDNSPLDDMTIELVNNVTTPLRTAQNQRNRENEMLTRMDKRLRAARSGLRDASRGLKRVEKEVEEVGGALEESELREAKTGNQQPHFQGRCPDCEHLTLSTLIGRAWSSWLRRFYIWDKRKWLPRLTWLGLITTLFWTWYFTEAVLWYV